MTRPVEIVLVYQSLLGIYGDRGNAMVLRQRLLQRGIDAELIEVEPGDVVPSTGSVYLLGGGEDAAQVSAVKHLKEDGHLFEAIGSGAVLFAVCAGYQIAGQTFTVGERDEIIEGLGLLDVTTRRGTERAVGEILTRWARPDGVEIAHHRLRESRRLHPPRPGRHAAGPRRARHRQCGRRHRGRRPGQGHRHLSSRSGAGPQPGPGRPPA